MPERIALITPTNVGFRAEAARPPSSQVTSVPLGFIAPEPPRMPKGATAVRPGATMHEPERPSPGAITRAPPFCPALAPVPPNIPVDPKRVPSVELDMVRLLELVPASAHLPRHLRVVISGPGPARGRKPRRAEPSVRAVAAKEVAPPRLLGARLNGAVAPMLERKATGGVPEVPVVAGPTPRGAPAELAPPSAVPRAAFQPLPSQTDKPPRNMSSRPQAVGAVRPPLPAAGIITSRARPLGPGTRTRARE